ncbi:hypothetical protein LUZ60_007437 [Juncus effusus]|nr:hypothetical protein LUZ60_007437 [Juncus effusus]
MSQLNPELSIACKRDGTCVAINGEPADSIELKIGEDIDWMDVSSVYERDDSVKETTNPKSHHNHTNNSTKSGSNSQRFSGNLKPSIIGLPGKIHNSGYIGHSSRRPTGIRIFPKKVKTGGGGKKQAVPETEPGSPKVSCIGKVLSERERVRRRLRQKPATVKTPAKKEEERKTSCWVRVAGIFFGGRRRAEKKGGVIASSSEREKEVAAEERINPVTVAAEEAAPAPAGIGGMKKFTSGRKVEWDFELAAEEEGKR